jgi:hypothetical protein
MLLLQPVIAADLATDMAGHPYVMAAIGAAMFATLVAVIKVLLGLMEKRINEKFSQVDKENASQDARLSTIESELKRYDTHVAVGAKETSEIHAAITRVEVSLADHVHKEETTTWAKIDELVKLFSDMKMGNELAHAGLINGQKSLSERVEAVENKMPNGELSKLADAFDRMSRQGRSVRAKK